MRRAAKVTVLSLMVFGVAWIASTQVDLRSPEVWYEAGGLPEEVETFLGRIAAVVRKGG